MAFKSLTTNRAVAKSGVVTKSSGFGSKLFRLPFPSKEPAPGGRV